MDEKSASVLNSRPAAVIWSKAVELGYESPAGAKQHQQESHQEGQPATQPKAVQACCFQCQTKPEKALKCSKCHVATYCGRDCQVKDWKAKHRAACDAFRRVGPQMLFLDKATEDHKADARRDIFQRVRFYACAYTVNQASKLGRGFLFLQSDKTLAAMSLTHPQDAFGRPIVNRSVLLHYLTLGEYDSELCRDDFEMATIRNELKELIENYDESTHIVLLMRFRCGHLALGKAVLVPEYSVCKKLGVDYFGENPPPSLQLNIDDA